MFRITLKILALAAVLVLLTAFYNRDKLSRLIHTISLFDADVIAENFQDMEENYPVKYMAPSTKPYHFPENKYYTPGGSFSFEGKTYPIERYLEETRTEGLLILKNDTIIYENYSLGLEEDESHISWSMAKSFTATLIGIYYEKGFFDLDDPIDKHLEDFRGTAYEGVHIRHLLNMSSGVAFNEDYGDFYSDINRFGRAFAMGSSMREFSKSLKREREPGTYNHYVSIDTEMLAFLLVKLTGKSLTELTREHIWEPMGMEHRASWIIDRDSMEMALGGLNASLRDFAKLGICYKNKGRFNNTRIVSPEWVEASLTMDQAHLKPGKTGLSSNPHGYGFQWWIPETNTAAFSMAGIYNQYVYVDPVHDIVIAKLSANDKFKQQGSITKYMHFIMFDAMIRDILGYPEGNLKG